MDERENITKAAGPTGNIPTDPVKTGVTIISSGYTVIATIHYLTFSDAPEMIILHYKEDQRQVILTFKEIEGQNPSMHYIDKCNDMGIIGLHFINFSNELGSWNKDVMPVGTIAGYPLFVRAKISGPFKPANFREISLTFYAEIIANEDKSAN
jgi:hypothetical protein